MAKHAINGIMNELKSNSGLALIVMDYKMKTLPQGCEEGQAEWFGKKGMSLMGAMVI